jgi:hypothetical protein
MRLTSEVPRESEWNPIVFPAQALLILEEHLADQEAEGVGMPGALAHPTCHSRLPVMDALDEALCRAWSLRLKDTSNDVDEELEKLLPLLIEAGYVRVWGHSPTGSFWAWTESGVKRAEELGCD